ncbi:MAG: nucleotidyltransferase family protein [Nitrospiraceae bacterium]|nr:nucleotidyltransferase family protein [Nitrospiraceae bacterium]
MRCQVSALLLAAGSSRRMGRTKQLLPVSERPAVTLCAAKLLEAGVTDVVVVTGTDHEGILDALAGLPLRYARNNNPGSDMAASVRAGLVALDPSAVTGVLVCLSDHPLVAADTIRALVRTHQEDKDTVLIPSCQGRRGHPSLFPFSVIQKIYSAASLRDIIRDASVKSLVLELEDEGVFLDMDTQEDYRRIIARADRRP